MYPYTIYSVCLMMVCYPQRVLFSDEHTMGDTLSVCSKLPHSVAGFWAGSTRPSAAGFLTGCELGGPTQACSYLEARLGKEFPIPRSLLWFLVGSIPRGLSAKASISPSCCPELTAFSSFAYAGPSTQQLTSSKSAEQGGDVAQW